MRFNLNMTLGKRIASGISLMLLLMLAVGMAGYFGLARVMGVTGFYQEINELRALVSEKSLNGAYAPLLDTMQKGSLFHARPICWP